MYMTDMTRKTRMSLSRSNFTKPMSYYRKYRPQVFSDLVGEDHIRDTLREAVKSNKLTHAYLLCGPRGTGKTTTARLLAKALNCETILAQRQAKTAISGEPCNKCVSCQEVAEGSAVDVIEIDAASHTKVDEIREIIDKAAFVPTRASKKIYIVDEVHMLSTSSFNALLKTLEEPPKHVIFILATTEVQKIPLTILSRTQRFDFKRVSKKDIVTNLKMVAKKEGLRLDERAADLIATKAEGGHRDALGYLEQIASISTDISEEKVKEVLGLAGSEEVYGFLGAIFNNYPEEGLKIAQDLYASGLSMNQLVKEVIELLRKLMVYRATGKFLFEDAEENLARIKAIADSTTTERIDKVIRNFLQAYQLLREVAYPILPVEMAVVNSIESIKSNVESETQEQGPVAENSKLKDQIPKQAQNPKPEIQNEETKGAQGEPKGGQRADKGVTEKEETKTAPVSVFQMTDDLWDEVINKVKAENATLAALLRDTKPLEVAEGKVRLGVKFPFHKAQISQTKNCKYLEGIIGEVLGYGVILGCEIIKDKPKEEKSADDAELMQAAEEIFA